MHAHEGCLRLPDRRHIEAIQRDRKACTSAFHIRLFPGPIGEEGFKASALRYCAEPSGFPSREEPLGERLGGDVGPYALYVYARAPHLAVRIRRKLARTRAAAPAGTVRGAWASR